MIDKEFLRNALLATGADSVRFTDTQPSRHKDYWRAWTNAGYAGEMLYLERHRELRTGYLGVPELLEGARTAIVVGVSYDHDVPQASPTQGVIAKYAQGNDYHNVLRALTKKIIAVIKLYYPNSRSRGSTDSTPIPERELAVRSGLGWQGRHTNVIAHGLGNFFFLSVILTTADITPDNNADVLEGCGSCTACMASCPTGAIVAPNTLNPLRCISYWTIEAKTSIPVELRSLLGNNIFGCDICLNVCPWNRFAKATSLDGFNWDSTRGSMELDKLFTTLADEKGFLSIFNLTPVLRAGREGLRRNVAVAMGNSGVRSFIPILEGGLDDDSPIVIEHIEWAISELLRC